MDPEHAVEQREDKRPGRQLKEVRGRTSQAKLQTNSARLNTPKHRKRYLNCHKKYL